MRIIAGTHRGRRVEAPPGRGTRPMLDRVREALFSTLAPWLEGARVLDLFAGSGSLSFEALSRGAASARLVEKDLAVLAVAARNTHALGLEERVELHQGDALAPLAWLVSDGEATSESPPNSSWDIVMCDPPYPLLRDDRSRRAVLDAVFTLAHAHLAPEGVLMLHAPAKELRGSVLEENAVPGLSVARRTYGTNALWFLQAEENPVEDAR